MGWIAKLYSGDIVREDDNVRWDDIDIHLIESLWIDGFEEYKIFRKNKKDFMEFIQFKTAAVNISGEFFIESRCIGWTDGQQEFIIRIDERNKNISEEVIKRIHFHPYSYFFKKVALPQNKGRLI